MKFGDKPYFYINIDAENNNDYNTDSVRAESAELLSCDGDGEVGLFRYGIRDKNLTLEVDRKKSKTAEVVSQKVTIKNEGIESVTVDTLSSLFVCGIGKNGKKKWHEDRFILHWCAFAWQGEGQWNHESIEKLGLYSSYNHGNQSYIRFSEVGSMSTRHFYPMIMLEDKELGEIWYFECECSTSWYIEVAAKGYRDASALCVFISNSYEKNDGFYQVLGPGESYTTCRASYGCIKGGFEEAVHELISYKREVNSVKWENKYPPVCFNDYMNCLWALPTREKLIPLIDKAAEAGCEVFCIDDGWYRFVGGDKHDMGSWYVNEALFGEGGLSGIIKYINEKGMKAGIWLEMESAMCDCDAAHEINGALLYRHGKLIGKERCFLNFLNPEVREYAIRVFDRLYELGIRYIKNDYNQTVGIGFDNDDFCMSRALHENTAAFLSIIDVLRVKYPDLYIESCSSGAMRCDNETLSHFCVQSTSDQEFYEKYPSVAQGMISLMPPEKAGIWAYPYPVPISMRETFSDNEEFASGFSDGRQTVFNMVTGMLGCLYMSGRITNADEYNMSLMREAVSLYKETRAYIPKSFPIYPDGLRHMSYNGFLSLGLFDEWDGIIMLAIWKKDTDLDEHCVDLSKYGEIESIIRVFPKNFEGTEYSHNGKSVRVHMPCGNCALYLVLKLK